MRERLLLHVCCAPCATAVIRRLRERFDLTLVFENPNIQPPPEHDLRLGELIRYARTWDLPVLEVPYRPERWNLAVRGLEQEPERGRRCEVCFRERLAEVARLAGEQGFPWLATTLTISPLKDARLILGIAREEGQRQGVKVLEEDFKKKDGFKESCRLSREAELYRQDYCGCEHSRRERDLRSPRGSEKFE